MNAQIDQLIARVEKTQHGFTDILRTAEELAASESAADRQRLAEALYVSPVTQGRMLAIYLYGDLAPQSEMALLFLRTVVSRDPNWRAQEILAQAFDRFCAATGYERALPTIIDWLSDESPNVRRAVTEGLRIWTSRPYFKDHPGDAIALLSQHRADPSEYLRKSVGNALRDISRKHPDLVRAELARWDVSDKRTKLTYKLASKLL
ncbi:MAG: DNA alkylation repair protein [Anaerolineae bacterium]|nr:DNA alkylation repair protein [Anaerolineae bacterium]